IKYSVKKTTWQSSGQGEIKFIVNEASPFPTIKNNGKVTEVSVKTGQPKESRPSIQKVTNKVQKQKASNTSYIKNSWNSSASINQNNITTSHLNNEGMKLPSATYNSSDSPGSKKRAPPPPPKKGPQCKALY
ncbi:hypothetical protein HK096_001859, partial [Nowakowskiella sp. JEL0078]